MNGWVRDDAEPSCRYGAPVECPEAADAAPTQALEAEQPPLAHGYGSRVRDGDGVKEDSWTSTDCIAAAVPMEWRGSNYSEMVFLPLSFLTELFLCHPLL
ncbi:hypothetical protein CFC21_053000 [Triticum aestivum]|uniref:Uncharacterized protein n=4 Tax=Triticum TaxID=4564 RepID=A0A9R0SDZ8_TRITD|nr:hypothetical protein TRIUR3_16138 [Triticum urartu]KAF7043675.1 hypothetical protein CFC21_053000 [Triticum aestivum]VAH93614.1 unnamed protein product [Triticum turgidum subsp. durum]